MSTAWKPDRLALAGAALPVLPGPRPTGGWSYRCPYRANPQHQALLATLKTKNLTPAKAPPYWRNLPIFQDPAQLVLEDPDKKGDEPQFGTTDNSNTQF